jgi:RNA polymerase sigma-70 factor (ECF subfamily)
MSDRGRPRSSRQSFATTHWSVVAAAGGESSTLARDALATLCTAYWYPLYAYVRRRGYQPDEAQDLVQGFLAQLLEKDRIRAADPARGRFRSFLLASFNNFVANQRRDAQAVKRGGGHRVLSLDFNSGEDRYHLEPSHEVTAEVIFQRRWAMTVLENAVDRLRQEFEQAGKADQFAILRVFLGGESEPPAYRDVAGELNTTEGAVKVAVHRLRRRCGEILRDEIAQTVTSEEDVDQELRDLFADLT